MSKKFILSKDFFSDKKYLILSLVGIFLIVISIILLLSGKSQKSQSNVVQSSKAIDLNYFIYIDNNYNLCKVKKDGSTKTVLDKNVLSFDLSDKDIVYSKKEIDKVRLYSFSMDTLSINKLFLLNSDDYILGDNFIYYMENKFLKKYDIKTANTEDIKELPSGDVVFSYVDKDFILLSYQSTAAAYTDKLSFTNKDEKHMLSNVFNVKYCNGYVYGLNDKGYLCRTKEGLSDIETINNFAIVKFDIQKEFLFYVSEDGKLNSLDANGSNRQISDYATDFRVTDSNIYFMASTDKNVVYRTQYTGQYKTLILDDINNDFYFREFKTNTL